MADIIITNGIVITIDRGSPRHRDGAVAIEKDRIVAVGHDRRNHWPPIRPTTIIDAKDKIVMPGLIDGHAHAGHGLIKTMGGGNSEHWYDACHAAYTVGLDAGILARGSPSCGARAAALRRYHRACRCWAAATRILRTDEPVYGDAHCEGVRDVGTRSVVAIGPTRPPHPRTYARSRTVRRARISRRLSNSSSRPASNLDRHLARHSWRPRSTSR